jgi:hypothetical protein
VGFERRTKLDSLDASLAKARDLSGRVTAKDRALLLRAYQEPVDVEEIEGEVDLHDGFWLLFYGLIETAVDGLDRVWIRTTQLGLQVAKAAA